MSVPRSVRVRQAPSVADLLRSPRLRSWQVLAGPTDRGRPDHVLVQELATSLPADAADAILVLTAAASRDATGYKLDVLLRRAGTAGTSAVVLTGGDRPRIPDSAARIAGQGGLALLAAPGPLTNVVLDAAAAVSGDATTALQLLGEAPSNLVPGTPEEVAAACAAFLGQPVELATSPPTGPAHVEPVPSAGEPARYFSTTRSSGYEGAVVEIVLALAAGAVARHTVTRDREEGSPARSAAALLAELVLSAEPSPVAVAGARRMGIPIDGWHRVARFQLPSDGQGHQPEAAQRWQALEMGMHGALRVAREDGRTWHATHIEGAVLLVHCQRGGPVGDRTIEPTIRRAAAHLAVAWGTPGIHVGIGTRREGLRGLKVSAAEARAALAGLRGRHEHVEVVQFDGVGLRRVLREWYSLESAQDAVAELLAPLERLSPARAAEAVRTLGAWLAEGGSAAATAERLYVHRNTVHYRIRQIERLLEVDLGDADVRLALALACRARGLQVA
ncbi:MAG TPA: helix-turn-helix domain-containing protein [Acidimicrobiales bacterium]|nr:helix-turn-helix domain-containing protein [Acidimicrobiales bacterium]